ncbi:MAG: cytosine permease [Kyrpidia tusciae]|nr:cytosine permease [Kyrpidia tusciae]
MCGDRAVYCDLGGLLRRVEGGAVGGTVGKQQVIVFPGPLRRRGEPAGHLRRASFGHQAAQIPVLIRAFVAIFWFAVQSWAGSKAVGAVGRPSHSELGGSG